MEHHSADPKPFIWTAPPDDILKKVARGRQTLEPLHYSAVSTAELAGEIGTIERFRGEASLALYLGMAPSIAVPASLAGRRHDRQR